MLERAHSTPSLPTLHAPDPDGTHVSIGEIIATILQAKRIVAMTTIIGVAIALGIGWHVSSFKSDGYFQFAQTFPEFKRLQVAVAAPNRWSEFSRTLDAAEAALFAEMTHALTDSKGSQNLIAPIYPVTKADLKNIPDPASTDTTPPISGLKFSVSARDPQTAQRGVQVLGDFVRDTAILVRHQDSIHTHHIEYLTSQRKYENKIIDAKYKLQQVQAKRNDMQKILHNYPEAAKEGHRQLVSIAEGGQRYLSPITQLVALEAEIADLNQSLLDITRKQRISSIYLRYYEDLLALLNKTTSGEGFMKDLPGVKDALKLDLSDEVEKSVYNSIAIDNLRAQALYFEKMRFIAEPTLPSQRSPSVSMMALLGLMLGILLGCSYALIRHFSHHRHTMQAGLSEERNELAIGLRT